jgi:hypothetical protein
MFCLAFLVLVVRSLLAFIVQNVGIPQIINSSCYAVSKALRGCLKMRSFFDALISYGRKDSLAFATKLYTRLLEQGLNVWFERAIFFWGDGVGDTVRWRRCLIPLSPSFIN